MLLSTAYFPPIEYFTILAKYSCHIDPEENYRKQSYRNRARILTSNGIEDLRVPIVHDGRRKVSEIRVDYSTPWVRRTRYATETAYFSSPFFEYYREPLFSILDSQPETLWELNRLLIEFFCARIGMPAPSFERPVGVVPGAEDDLRELIHPKKPAFLPTPQYWQVFREKFGFTPNLSILDLLCNEGPESICVLNGTF